MKKPIALLLALAMVLSFAACAQKTDSPDATKPTGTTGPNTPQKDPAELHEIYRRESYTGEKDAVLAAADTVVATLGDAQLTNSMLHFYYWMGVYNFLSTYGNYVGQTGLDPSKPLDEQKCASNDGTWQHYFLDNALNAWHYYQAMAEECDATQTPLSADYQKALETFYDDMTESAKENKFDSIDAMIQTDMGICTTSKDYYLYTETGYKAHSYFNKLFYEIEITDKMLEDYFVEHEASLAVNGITKKSGDCCSVRHILIEVDTKKTADDWEKCRQEAQKLLDQWLAGDATEDSFAQLAKEHSADPGSKGEGGLYTGLTDKTSFVQEFKDWYLEKDRKAGDYGLVKTSYGYHIMYFSGTEPIWEYYCRECLTDEQSADAVNKVIEKYELKVEYDKILLDEIKLIEDK